MKEFIQEAIIVHGLRYIYPTDQVYTNTDKPLIITCRHHGSFSQSRTKHLKGRGCRKCGNITATRAKKRKTLRVLLDTQMPCTISIEQVSKNNITTKCLFHGSTTTTIGNFNRNTKSGNFCNRCTISNKYLQRLTHAQNSLLFSNTCNIITYKCNTCNTVSTSRADRVLEKGCKQCNITGIHENTEESRKLTFIKQCIAIHGDSYDYSSIKYSSQEVYNIKCNTCLEFFNQAPNNHKRKGYGHCNSVYGFKDYLPAVVYILKHTNYDIWKIGITNNSVKERYTQQELKSFEVLYESHYLIGSSIRKIEQKVLNKLIQYKYIGPALLKAGNTELLTTDPISYVVKELEHE